MYRERILKPASYNIKKTTLGKSMKITKGGKGKRKRKDKGIRQRERKCYALLWLKQRNVVHRIGITLRLFLSRLTDPHKSKWKLSSDE